MYAKTASATFGVIGQGAALPRRWKTVVGGVRRGSVTDRVANGLPVGVG
jgi:hypothetical protein